MDGLSDFDEFIDFLEGGSDKAFRMMFKDLGRQARVSKNPPRNARKAAAGLRRGGAKGPSRATAKQMEKDMMDMMMGMSLG